MKGRLEFHYWVSVAVCHWATIERGQGVMGVERQILERVFKWKLLLLSFFILALLSPLSRLMAAPTPPKVRTDAATKGYSSGNSFYVLHGEITDTGGESCDRRGFDYRKQGESDWLEWVESGSFGAGAFSTPNLYGLETGAVYAVKAKAHNSAGWSYGKTLTFRTLQPPQLATEGVTGVTSSSATFHGAMLDDGGEACMRRGFVYRKQGQTGGMTVWEDGSFTPRVVVTDGFDDGDLAPFNTSGTPWSVSDEDFYTAPYSAVSGAVGVEEESVLALAVEMPSDGTVRFAREVLGEEDNCSLAFFVDGAERDSWSGKLLWSESSYPLERGMHDLKWVFRSEAKEHTARVDEIYITCPAPYSLTAGDLEPYTDYEVVAFAYNYLSYGGLQHFL